MAVAQQMLCLINVLKILCGKKYNVLKNRQMVLKK